MIFHIQKSKSLKKEFNIRYEKNFYANSKTYTLIEPTIDLRVIWKTAENLLKSIYKNHHLYSKVGIILSEFHDAKFIQQSYKNDTFNSITTAIRG